MATRRSYTPCHKTAGKNLISYDNFRIRILVAAVLLGAFLGQCIVWMSFPGVPSLLGVWGFSWLFYVLLISDMFVGFNVLPFPFIVFGVGAGLLAWFILEAGEIGRASCRERVCQYVSISVVAVSLK